MLNYKPELTPDGDVKPVFNPEDFEKQYASVTYADLLDYANLYSSNNFRGSNYALGKKQPTPEFRTGDYRYSHEPVQITQVIQMLTEPYYRFMLDGKMLVFQNMTY